MRAGCGSCGADFAVEQEEAGFAQCDACKAREFDPSRPDDLRALGWMVAVHNDYMQNGFFHTFWLLTHKVTGTYVKGEGLTDAAALNRVRAQISDPTECTCPEFWFPESRTYRRYPHGYGGLSHHVSCEKRKRAEAAGD